MARARRRGSRSRRSGAGSSRRQGGSRSTRSVSQRASARIDLDAFTASVAEEVVPRLGLDILGLRREEYVEMLKPIVSGLLEQYSSRPSKQAVASKLLANPRPVYLYAAAYVLEKREELTEEQVEFIVSNAPEIAARYASRLYEAAVKHGRRDLVAMLRSAWEQYGHPTPVPCPRCGFRAVTPDLVCMVCGYELDEKEAKEAIDFEARLREFAEMYPASDVREAVERGYVIVGVDYLKPPSADREPTDIVLHLDQRERELLRRLLVEKRATTARL